MVEVNPVPLIFFLDSIPESLKDPKQEEKLRFKKARAIRFF